MTSTLDLLGAHRRDIGRAPQFDADDERALAGRIAAGDRQAAELLTWAGLPLVLKLARGFHGLDLEDLVGAGHVGLLRAVETFDPDRGRFSTHATNWIKQAIRRAIRTQSRTVRVPEYLSGAVAVWRRLSGTLGRDASAEELAAELAKSGTRYGSSAASLQAAAQRAITCAGRSPASLDAGEQAAADRIEDAGPGPAGALVSAERRAAVRAAVAELPERLSLVLIRRYGLDLVGQRTLAEVGDELGLSRERVRQLEREGLRKLRPILGAFA